MFHGMQRHAKVLAFFVLILFWRCPEHRAKWQNSSTEMVESSTVPEEETVRQSVATK
jgi:hypothetical protein